MNSVFYTSAAVAVIATLMVVTRARAMHALLYLIVSFVAIALVFFVLGAPFAAALEVIIYAGAIMVLFVFVIMMLNLGSGAPGEPEFPSGGAWAGPAVLGGVLLAELVWIIANGASTATAAAVSPKQAAIALYGPYVLGVEMASFLLLAGIVGAWHLGRGSRPGDAPEGEV